MPGWPPRSAGSAGPAGTNPALASTRWDATFRWDVAARSRRSPAAPGAAAVEFDHIAEAEALRPPAAPRHAASRTDPRLAYLNQTQYRNDLQVFEFDPKAAAFGEGGGRILSATLEGEDGSTLAWIVGGEVVVLRIVCEALEALDHPIIGFYVKNGLGQQLFGDNTFFSSLRTELATGAGEQFEARFVFRMPILPSGDYPVAVALADGTQVDHIMHHWMHDALAFKSTASPLRASGLLGLPMFDVAIERVRRPAAVFAPAGATA